MNTKWESLDQSKKSKILKVKALVDRGSCDEEKSAAQSRLDSILAKNELTIKDIPQHVH